MAKASEMEVLLLCVHLSVYSYALERVAPYFFELLTRVVAYMRSSKNVSLLTVCSYFLCEVGETVHGGVEAW